MAITLNLTQGSGSICDCLSQDCWQTYLDNCCGCCGECPHEFNSAFSSAFKSSCWCNPNSCSGYISYDVEFKLDWLTLADLDAYGKVAAGGFWYDTALQQNVPTKGYTRYDPDKGYTVAGPNNINIPGDGMVSLKNAYQDCDPFYGGPPEVVYGTPYNTSNDFYFWWNQNSDCKPETSPTLTQISVINKSTTGQPDITVNGDPIAPGSTWISNTVASAGFNTGYQDAFVGGTLIQVRVPVPMRLQPIHKKPAPKRRRVKLVFKRPQRQHIFA